MGSSEIGWRKQVRGVVRRYPELVVAEHALRQTRVTAEVTGMPGGHGRTADPVADAALRTLPPRQQRELDAVRAALRETFALRDGRERLAMISLVYWRQVTNLGGAGLRLHRCDRTICNWNGAFLKLVALKLGIFYKELTKITNDAENAEKTVVKC